MDPGWLMIAGGEAECKVYSVNNARYNTRSTVTGPEADRGDKISQKDNKSLPALRQRGRMFRQRGATDYVSKSLVKTLVKSL